MSWTHIRDTTPTARKPHRCYLCGGPVAVGDKYVRRVGVHSSKFDGLDSFAMHARCSDFATTSNYDWEAQHDSGEFAAWLDEEEPTP